MWSLAMFYIRNSDLDKLQARLSNQACLLACGKESIGRAGQAEAGN
jgi:hypothetical protein